MTYEQLRALRPGDFKRACGVYPTTFEHMLQVLREHEQRKVKPGRPPKLSLENQLLMTLQYWREYRTYFHIGLSWGLDESVVCRTVQRTENRLIQSKTFHVPGKKKLRAGGSELAVIVVDVSEMPVERPQKNSGHTTVGRKNATRRKRSSSWRTRPVKSSVSQLAKDESTISNCSNGVSLS
jgi:Helix-turn-helix of DDE superfamily endonuclease